MTTPDANIGLVANPPQLVISRCAQNRHYRDAVETPALVDAVELRARALQMRAALPPVPAVPMPPNANADLDQWLDVTAKIADLERARATRDEALARLIAAQEATISSIASTQDRALARLHQALTGVMDVAAEIVARLNGCANAAQIVASGDPDVLGAYQDLRGLRQEYDSVRVAQGWLMVGDPRADRHRSEWLYDDDLADDTQIANLDEVFPRWKRHQAEFSITTITDQPQPDPRPWPKDPVDQLIYLVVSPARVWVPTRTQLRELGQRRLAERAHAPGNTRRPRQRPERTLEKPKGNAVVETLNREIPA